MKIKLLAAALLLALTPNAWSTPIGFKGNFLTLTPIDKAAAPNGSVLLDSTNSNAFTLKDSSGNPLTFLPLSGGTMTGPLSITGTSLNYFQGNTTFDGTVQINGALGVPRGGSAPTCDASHVGQIYVTQAVLSTPDAIQICAESNTSPATYGWTAMGGGGFANPMTALGDLLYENGTPTVARLPGNTSATKKYLTQTGTGSVSAAPVWGPISSSDIPDLSATYLTKANNLSDVASKSTSFNNLSPNTTEGDLTYYHSGSNARLAAGPAGSVLTSTGTAPNWVPAASAGAVSASYTCSSCTIGSSSQVQFDSKTTDSNNAVTTGSAWAFKAPFAGNYFSCFTTETLNSGSINFNFKINGTSSGPGGQAGVSSSGSVCTILPAQQNDSIILWTNATSGQIASASVSISIVSGGSAPTPESITVLTSGSGTYTVPNGAYEIEVEMSGGGGGGGGSGTAAGTPGGAGGNTTLGSFLTANGGAGGTENGSTATGGTVSVAAPAVTLAANQGGPSSGGGEGTGGSWAAGGVGGVNALGGAGGAGAWGANASAAIANTGGGGGGAGAYPGGGEAAGDGGGAGGYIHAIIPNPSGLSFSYSVGSGGSAGVGGGSNPFNGGAGGSGVIIVRAKFPQGGSGSGSGVLSVVNGGDAAYSILFSDNHVRSGTTLTANRTYTLDPCTGSNIGEKHYVKNLPTQTFTVTVAGNGSDKIDNAANFILNPGDSVGVVCAATANWDIE